MPSVRHSRTQRSKSRSSRKCLRPGPIGRNPYLNFLREFRRKCCGMSPVKTIQQGAKAWNDLTPEQRSRYVNEAFYAPKRKRSMHRGGVKRLMASKRRGRHISRRRSRRGARNMSKSGPKRRSRSRSKSTRRTNRRARSNRSNMMCKL